MTKHLNLSTNETISLCLKYVKSFLQIEIDELQKKRKTFKEYSKTFESAKKEIEYLIFFIELEIEELKRQIKNITYVNKSTLAEALDEKNNVCECIKRIREIIRD